MNTNLIQRITHFVAAPEPHVFDELATEAFRYQFERVAPFRRLCEAREVTPATLGSWQEIPAVPVMAFKTMALHSAPPIETFRSSGTTGSERSVHYHPFPDLYRQVIDTSFPVACLPPGDLLDKNPAMLSLIPPRDLIRDSSLGFMVDRILQKHASRDSIYAFGANGVEPQRANTWCERQIAEKRPVLILATSFALVQWLDSLNDKIRSLPLPRGSAVFDTGGFKGRTREVSRQELVDNLGLRLSIPPHRIIREYGMTELTSQLYTGVLGQNSQLFTGPPWLRIQIMNPETLTPSPPGIPGLVAIFDLANIGSALHVLTQDRGVVEGVDRAEHGLRLLGRASGAELRGCSLTAEALGEGGML